MNSPQIKLTSLAHGGGCGCKLAPSVLQKLLAGQDTAGPFARLLVGTETGDDAAVWQLDDETCIIATTDFFMPIVDDPHDFGRIAATNAISDVYAMGGQPIMALAILGVPLDKVPLETVRLILAGGAAACADAGIPVAGGHSIDTLEPIYGLAVIGTCPRRNVRRNTDAKSGDALILTKPLGVGVYSAALKKGKLSNDSYVEMLGSTTLLNRDGYQPFPRTICPRHHRCDRLRSARARPGDGARLGCNDRNRCGRSPVVAGSNPAHSRRVRDRRFRTQLDELWR